MNKIYLLIIILFFLQICYCYSFSDSSSTTCDVYLIKSRWHTGLIFKINEILLNNIEAVRFFSKMKYVDIGWGDKDFYQSNKDFDIYLAFKALFIPTESVVRIEGYKNEIDEIISYSDVCIKFEFSEKQLTNLSKFIDSSFSRNEKNKLIVTLKKAGNQTVFFKSEYKYHILETCNKWVAKGLAAAGFSISTTWIITAENLFEEVKKYGKIIRWKE
ncbi:MAG: DUF2459 domain-containing protein [Ignavibacteriae bacterium]|nr:DUF2459 domain-containing protein [Ignavibacteriota bacterium]